MKNEDLKKIALESRKIILKMITEAASGHPGGSLSAIDILTVLYFDEMKHDPKNLDTQNRDHFVLGKGHGVPALYATLAQAGYFDVSAVFMVTATVETLPFAGAFVEKEVTPTPLFSCFPSTVQTRVDLLRSTEKLSIFISTD
jgi:transketolase N-terminal domain/subunit